MNDGGPIGAISFTQCAWVRFHGDVVSRSGQSQRIAQGILSPRKLVSTPLRRSGPFVDPPSLGRGVARSCFVGACGPAVGVGQARVFDGHFSARRGTMVLTRMPARESGGNACRDLTRARFKSSDEAASGPLLAASLPGCFGAQDPTRG